jgi:hypothetical protein
MTMDHLCKHNQIHLFELNHLQLRLELDVLVMKGNIGDYLIYLISLLPLFHLLSLIDIIRVILPGGLILHHPKLPKYHKDHMILDIHPYPPKAKHKGNQTSLHLHHRDYHDTPYRLLRPILVLLHKSLGDYLKHKLNLIPISECLALKKGLVLS